MSGVLGLQKHRSEFEQATQSWTLDDTLLDLLFNLLNLITNKLLNPKPCASGTVCSSKRLLSPGGTLKAQTGQRGPDFITSETKVKTKGVTDHKNYINIKKRKSFSILSSFFFFSSLKLSKHMNKILEKGLMFTNFGVEGFLNCCQGFFIAILAVDPNL